ncbi:MAG: LysR family transcriptional regulator [Verrucomicrobiales bacterium]|nr:LysR family transcriptional regulator [Verrucomicrobiales bacterium]
MEIHQLRYFVAVAEEGNFSRAAARVRVAQPSLSQQIQKLEAEVGQRLFDRLPRTVVLTEAGQRFLGFAQKILTGIADAKRCLDECDGEVIGRLAIGAIPTIAPYILPRLLQEFRKSHPRVTVEVVEDVTEHLARGMEDGDLDLALVSTCRAGPNVHRQPLGKEPLLVALPARHRLAQRAGIAWRDLKPEKFLVLHEMHCLSRQVARLCTAHAVRPEVVLQGAQLCTVVGLVAAGLGVSLVPQMMVRHEKESGCVFLPLAGTAPERELNWIRNPQRYQSKASAALTECAASLLARGAAQGEGGRPDFATNARTDKSGDSHNPI